MPGIRGRAAAAAEVGGEQPRLVDGVAVVKDEPELSPLPSKPGAPPIAFKTRRVLTLADGTQTYACADCPEITGSKGDIVKHRVDQHGAGKGGARPKDSGPSENVMRMTIGEVLRHAEQVDQWEAVVTATEARATTAEARAAAAESRLRKIDRALERAGFTLKVEEDD